MKKLMLVAALSAALPLVAQAQDGGWSGSGEVGIAATRGNSKSENVNIKLQFKQEDDTWKNNVFLNALRSKGEVTVATVVDGQTVNVRRYDLTANRYEAGGSVGFKLDERSYVVGALRYENDDFAAFDYQWIASIGYGYTALKNQRTELSFEIGPGYKRYQPSAYDVVSGDPPITTRIRPDADGQVVARGLISFRHKITDNTTFENVLLTEAGSDNTFLQNDAGLAVAMSEKFALKLGYQVRHNTDVADSAKKTDQLLTTNLVYNF